MILFLVTMGLTAATYFIVHRTLLKRETAKVRDRLSGRAGPASASSPEAASLFLPEGADQSRLVNRLLAKMNVDRQLQSMIEQAGVSWAPGQVCITALLLALLAFNAVWYLFPFWQKWGIHFIQVHPMGCGLAAPEQECEIARIVRVAAKPTHTRIHCGGSLRAATPRIGRATQPHAAPEQ